MPRGSRFERDRIAKLFGQHKTKQIHKPSPTTCKLNFDSQIESTIKQTEQKVSKFNPNNYLQLVKTYRGPHNQQQIQKISFRCYDDAEVYGSGKLIQFLKQTYDNDHDTPEEQVKYDVNKGVKRLFEDIEARKAKIIEGKFESDQAKSQKAKSFGSTPPRFIKRSHK